MKVEWVSTSRTNIVLSIGRALPYNLEQMPFGRKRMIVAVIVDHVTVKVHDVIVCEELSRRLDQEWK